MEDREQESIISKEELEITWRLIHKSEDLMLALIINCGTINTCLFMSLTAGAGTRCMSLLSEKIP